MTRFARNTSLILLFASAAAAAQEDATEELPVDEPDNAPFEESLPGTEAASLPMEQTVPVAESGEPALVEPLSDEELLQLEFERYKQLIADGVLDEADSTAKRVIELAIRTSGPDSIETSRALSNLGNVQYRLGQYESAAQNFQSAITIIEEVEDRLHSSLVNPIRGLGASQLAAGRPDLAVQTFTRGVHITHVNDGPHNMGQVELLETLAESRLRMGLIDEAKSAHESIYSLNLRFFQSNPLDMVPSLMRRASWQNRTGYILDERSTYRHVIRIIESATSKTDVRLIPPLTRMGRSFFYPDRSGVEQYAVDSTTAGELYFKRALRIARESPESNWDILSGALIAIADYNMMLSQSRMVRAKNRYEEAWAILADGNEGKRKDKLRSEFGKPKALRFFPLPKFAGSATAADRANPDVALREGSIRFSYDVSERGKIANFKIIEANPSEFYDIRRSVIREMRGRQYRPRFDSGEPTETTGLIGTHRFLYKQSDLMALRRQEQAEQEEETKDKPADTETDT